MYRNLRFSWRLAAVLMFVLWTAAVAKPARAAQDIVEFGSDIDVPPADTIHDAVCFFCSVNVKGTVNGDIVVFFGSVRIDGHANHDVVNFFGSVTAGNDTAIGHDLVNFFGGVRLGENVTVGQDTVVMFGNLHRADTVSFGGSRVVEPGWLFWGPLAVLVLGIYYIIHEFRLHRRRRVLGF